MVGILGDGVSINHSLADSNTILHSKGASWLVYIMCPGVWLWYEDRYFSVIRWYYPVVLLRHDATVIEVALWQLV